MRLLVFVSIAALSLFATAAPTPTSGAGPKICQSADELKKAYQFLNKQTDLGLNHQQTLKLSIQISSHCTGATERFQKIYSQLQKVGVAIPKNLEIALQYSQRTDQQVELFLESIRILFLEKNYDLSFYDAFKWADIYANATTSQQKYLKEDLKFLIQFCLGEKKDLLPLPICRDYSLQLLDIATQEYRGSIREDFKQLLTFLTTGTGPKYPFDQSFEIIVQVLKLGQNATEQFIQSYRFASAKEGLNLGPEQSYKIAFQSAQASQMTE